MFGFRLNRQKGLPPTPPKQVIPFARRITAAIAPRTINQLVRGAEWAARFNGGGSLPLSNAANGPKLSYAGPVTVMAKLSGSGPAYNWVEVVDSPKAGFPVLTGGRSGTGNAYEANGKTGLSGSVVCLKFTPANDWRFQYIGVGIPAPVGCTFCVSITDQCTSAAVVPTSAVLKSGSTVIATATIGNQLMSVTITAGGTGYTAGWHTLGISGGGGSGAAGEFFVSGGAVTKVSLTANGSGYTSAPTISFPGAGGSGATATATVGNTACFQAISTGSYTLAITATGYLDFSTPISVNSFCSTATASMTPNTRTVSVQVNNSCTGTGVANGATVTATQGGVTIATGTTDATGKVTFTGVPVSVSTTFTCSGYTRFATGTLVATIPSGCSTYSAGTITLNPASGYACWGSGCEYPVKTTLNCTDSVYGAFTATYNGSGGWDGSLAISYPGVGGGVCPPCAITLSYSLGPGVSSVNCAGVAGALCTCPDPGGSPGSIGDNFNETSLTCPLSFAATLTRSTFTSCIWGTSSTTVTITITE